MNITKAKLNLDINKIKYKKNHMPASWRQLFENPKMALLEEVGEVDPQSHYGYGTFGDLNGICNDQNKIIDIRYLMKIQPSNIDFDRYKKEYLNFYQQLRPIPSIQSRIDAFIEKNRLAGVPMVGVHIRRYGKKNEDDYWKNKVNLENMIRNYEEEMGKPMIELYKEEMRKALKSNPKTVFYVAAEDPVDVKKLEEDKELKGRIYSLSQEVAKRQDVADQQGAIAEWSFFANTDYIIGTNGSSFSDEAAVLSKQQKKIQIGPSFLDAAMERIGIPFIKEYAIHSEEQVTVEESKEQKEKALRK
ncbi:MAG: O-fucosyltransferase family protein [Oligoflexia bacterium]|nr:O-fucosyltransferase family protein [Oligoflexia bacterium]